MHQRETCEIGVRLLQQLAAWMSFCFLTTIACPLVEVDWQSAYRLGEYPYTCPYSRDGKGTFLRDEDCSGVVGNGVSEKRLVDGRLEL